MPTQKKNPKKQKKFRQIFVAEYCTYDTVFMCYMSGTRLQLIVMIVITECDHVNNFG